MKVVKASLMILVLMVWGIANGPAAMAQSGDLLKSLGLRPVPRGGGGLEVDFSPVSPEFKVNEGVRFKIKGNKKFYLWLFSINQETNRGILIWPNPENPGNRYEGGREFLVPHSPKLEFVATEPGTEKIVMVASTKWLDMAERKMAPQGVFFSGTAEAALSDVKSLYVRLSKAEKDTVVEEIQVNIKGAEPTPVNPPEPAPSDPEAARPAVPFISTDRQAYRLGEPIKIVYGADQPGVVYLFVMAPGSDRLELLKKQETAGKQIHEAFGKALEPLGGHAILAVFDPEGKIDETAVHLADPENPAKGVVVDQEPSGKNVQLIEPKPLPYRVQFFDIRE